MVLQMRFKKSGFLDLKRGLKSFQKEALINGTIGLIEGARMIQRESIKEVPKDTTALSQSTFVSDQIFATVLRSKVRVGYGGPSAKVNPRTLKSTAEYMVKVHEDLAQHHNNGKAKFLEDPANRLFPEIINLIGEYIAKTTI